jgi:hypothetical protein
MPKPSIPPQDCQQCGRFSAEMQDPTFDAARALPGTLPLLICAHCAAVNIESEMARLGATIQ